MNLYPVTPNSLMTFVHMRGGLQDW